MPTIPPERGRPTRTEPHRVREIAESFGLDAARYDRARPRYPAAMVERIAAGPGRDVLDVGCGTGIAARQFQKAGCAVVGVEPDARMAARARQRGLEVEVSTFEAWDGADRAFDAVVAGQTWHWVDPDAGAAKAAHVLRSGGRLAVFWNDARPPREAADAFAAVYDRVLPDSLASRQWAAGFDGYQELCAKAAEGMARTGAFGACEQWRFDWERTYSRAEWLDQLQTTGGHTRLPPAKLDEVLEGVGAAVDVMGGSFTVRYTTVVVTATRVTG